MSTVEEPQVTVTPVTEEPSRTGWRLFVCFLALFLLVAIPLQVYRGAQRPILFEDESSYLNRGAELVEKGLFSPISANPAVLLLSAASYIPVKSHPLGLHYAGKIQNVVTTGAASVVLFLLVYLLAGPAVAIAAGVAFLLFPALGMVSTNPSDALYTTAVGGVLLGLLRMESKPCESRSVFMLSVLTLFAALSRNDGFPAFLALTPVVGFFHLRSNSSLPWWRRTLVFLSAWCAPFLLGMACCILAAWVTKGQLEFLPGSRAYVAFEQGVGLEHTAELQAQHKDPWYSGQELAGSLYGTREETGLSVWRAVLNNPRAWSGHVAWSFREFITCWKAACGGGRPGLLLIQLCLLGAVLLLANERLLLFLSISAVLSPCLIYFLVTFWRSGYVAMYGILWFLLAVIAVKNVFDAGINLKRVSPILVGMVLSTVLTMLFIRNTVSAYSTLDFAECALGVFFLAIYGYLVYVTWAMESVPGRFHAIGGSLCAALVAIAAVRIVDQQFVDFSANTTLARQAQAAMQQDYLAYIRTARKEWPHAVITGRELSLAKYARQPIRFAYDISEKSPAAQLQAALVAQRADYLLLLFPPPKDPSLTVVWHQGNVWLVGSRSAEKASRTPA